MLFGKTKKVGDYFKEDSSEGERNKVMWLSS